MEGESTDSVHAPPTTGDKPSTGNGRIVQPQQKLPRRNNYFQVSDIVWVKPPRLPFWPAEIITELDGSSRFVCRLFFPPEGCPHDITTTIAKLYFFDRLYTDEEMHAVVEGRLQRDKHKVEAYEADFTRAVRRANDLVRIVLDPSRMRSFEVHPIGCVRSLMRTHISAPRQPHTGAFEPQPAVIVLRPGLENAVRDLKGFDWVWVVFQFSYACIDGATSEGPPTSSPKPEEPSTPQEGAASPADKAPVNAAEAGLPKGWKTMVVPPRDTVLRGVFATRSPHRPNFIGLSCVRLVDVRGLEVHIADHDLLHGTPVLDIKPYLPFCDAHPEANAGWVTALDSSGKGGADHRGTAGPSVHRNFDVETQGEKTRHAPSANSK